MTFDVSADAYARFMGRYSEPLAAEFARLADLRPGLRALDVGCGPGALTAHLVDRLGPGAVTAIDPSASFVSAARERFPGVDVRTGSAELLPFEDAAFDLAMAQLVVHFMTDPVAGLREMGRVTRPGGLVAACVWDHAGSGGPLNLFWRAVKDLDPGARDGADLPGARAGHLEELCAAAGLTRVEAMTLTATSRFASFAEWWGSFTLGVGPAGAYVVGLGDVERDRLRRHCEELLPAAPFEVTASAWCVTARA